MSSFLSSTTPHTYGECAPYARQSRPDILVGDDPLGLDNDDELHAGHTVQQSLRTKEQSRNSVPYSQMKAGEEPDVFAL